MAKAMNRSIDPALSLKRVSHVRRFVESDRRVERGVPDGLRYHRGDGVALRARLVQLPALGVVGAAAEAQGEAHPADLLPAQVEVDWSTPQQVM